MSPAWSDADAANARSIARAFAASQRKLRNQDDKKELVQAAMLELTKRDRNKVKNLKAYVRKICSIEVAKLLDRHRIERQGRDQLARALEGDYESPEQTGWSVQQVAQHELRERVSAACMPNLDDVFRTLMRDDEAARGKQPLGSDGALAADLFAAARAIVIAERLGPELTEVASLYMRPMLLQHGAALDRIARGRGRPSRYRELVRRYGLTDDFLGLRRQATPRELTLLGVASGWLDPASDDHPKKIIRHEEQNVRRYLARMKGAPHDSLAARLRRRQHTKLVKGKSRAWPE